MNSLRRVGSLVALAMLVLAGSAVGSPNPQSFGYEEWEDAVKVRGVDPRDAVYPFQVTPEIRAGVEDIEDDVKLALKAKTPGKVSRSAALREMLAAGVEALRAKYRPEAPESASQ